MNRAALIGLLVASALPLACKGGDGTTDETAGTTGSTATTGGTTAGTMSGTTGGTTTAGTTTAGTTTAGTTAGTTTTTSTTTQTTGMGVECDPQNLPAEGSPCSMPGQFCSPGCQDPCQFCNILECVDGTWQPAEVFPAPCASCEEVCPAVVDAGCPGGPPDLTECINGCNMNVVGPCKVEYGQLRVCAGLSPTFTCDMNGRPVVEGCESEFEAFYACLFP